jgi:hypothetical protein
MTPTTAGRHCTACQKTVVDFTHKTDAEILAALRHAAGETCGRLRADQVGRPLVAPSSAPRWRAWLGAALAVGGVFGAGRAAAQSQESYYAGPRPAASPSSSTAPPKPSRTADTSSDRSVSITNGLATIRGIVTDSATHEGIPGVTVLLKGTTTGVSTDASGAFSLSVAAQVLPAHLTFSSIGYFSEERVVTPGQPLSIALAANTLMLGGMDVVMVGGVSQHPWPWHPRRFFNWSKYWLTKPFQN